MKVHNAEQGSGEWYKVRLGIPTASQFHKIITPTGKLSTQSRTYMYRLIAERLLRDTMDDQLGYIEHVQRGKEEEPNAVRQFEFANHLETAATGFITTDDGRVGCSPDRRIVRRNEAVEIKCPMPPKMIEYLLEGPGTDYRPQVQGQLLVGEFEAVHFYAYHPRMPAAQIVTLRDEKFIDLLTDGLERFLEDLDEKTERARALGAYVATEWPVLPLEQAYPEVAGPDPLQIIIPE